MDVHAFDPSRPLMIAGVHVPKAPGLAGHSDGDVLSHAIADALLGAAKLGDLGERFPADERWKDAPGVAILEATARLLDHEDVKVVNVDATVVAETPRLAPHRAEMVTNVADALGIDPELVSIKATTSDGLGFAGRDEGMAAFAVVLIENTLRVR